MGLNALYSNTFSNAFITANEPDFDEFIRLSTLASQNIVNGIDPSKQEETLYRMIILLEAIDYNGITDKEEETLRYCLSAIRTKTPTLSENFFSDEFLDMYCSSFKEFLRLMTEASERLVNGKESKSRVDTAGRLLVILSALKNSSSLTDDNIESLRYCLLNLNVTLTDRSIEAIITPCVEEAQSYSMVASAGLFTLTGQAATFTLAFSISAEHGSFTLTGQNATFTLAHSVVAEQGSFVLTGQDAEFTHTRPRYDLELVLSEAISGSPSWSAYFEMVSSPFDNDTLVATGNGATDSGELTGIGNILCNVYKTTNGGIAEDAGTVEFFINGALQDSQNFIATDDVGVGTPKTYTFTGLSNFDDLKVEVTEG